MHMSVDLAALRPPFITAEITPKTTLHLILGKRVLRLG